MALQSAEAEALLPGVDVETRMASWHLVTAEGQVYSAGAAFDPLMRVLGRWRLLGAFARRFPRVTEAGYRWVADHRGLFGRFLRK